MSEIASTAKIGLSYIGKALNLLRNRQAGDSLISFTQAARVEPLMLVDQRIKDHSKAIDTAQALQTLFTGFYLQAIQLGGENVMSVKMMKTLDKFNPTRDSMMNLANNRLMTALEGYEHSLPEPISEVALENLESNSGNHLQNARTRYALNVANSSTMSVALEAQDEDAGDKNPGEGVRVGKIDAGRELKEQANLSVGRLVNVTLAENGNSITVPVMIRLSAQFVDSSRMVHILTTNALDDTSARDRLYGWKSGAKSLIGDIIFANDLIERERSRLAKDSDGLYSTIVSRKNKGFLNAALSGTASVGAASALVMISQDTADEIEAELGASLDNYKTRQKIFENTSVMIMAVLDTGWNKVTFYYRGIPTSNSVDMGALSANKGGSGGGADVMDILKAFSLGNAPKL